MQLGTVDGFFITANNVSPHWNLMDVTVLPYIFQNAKHLEDVVDGDVGDFMKSQLQKDTSVHLLSLFSLNKSSKSHEPQVGNIFQILNQPIIDLTSPINRHHPVFYYQIPPEV